MEIINLLDFLNNVKELHALDYATCNYKLINFLDLITEDEQFTQKIDLGIVHVHPQSLDHYVIVDGLNRFVSLSLLLHAVCECYKKTTPKNEIAISTIRKKYLLNDGKTKLRLRAEDQEIYNKIIFGERLSGKEKETPMFQLLHKFWVQIKTEKIQAANIFKILGKISIILVNTDNVPKRDLYYALNKDKRELNQLLLIEDYLKNIGILEDWNKIKKVYCNNIDDISLFFKDLFITKFNFKKYKQNRLYELFVNYFETMLQYFPEDVLIDKMKRSAVIYHKILNVNIENESLKQALIQIKIHKGEDTYAYILNIFEDYVDNRVSEATFLEILQTIDEYLKNRIKTPNSVSFNELVEYLNAFITCK